MMPIGRAEKHHEFAWKGATFAGELCVETGRDESSQVKSSQPKNTLPIPEIVMPWTVSFGSGGMPMTIIGHAGHDER